jgi:5-methyltetrahydropteroyltriglutamate--homocysteine methyltransferase
MLTSKDRILTTHCGSLPRPAQLSDLLLRQEAGEPIDSEMLRRECADAVSRALEGQMQAGIDIVSDGEQPRVGFSMYVPLRMEGFGGESVRPTPRDLDDFPLFTERLSETRGRRNRIANPPKAIAEVRYTGVEDARAEYQLFKNALGALRQQPAETFMTAASPGIIATTMANEYYDSYEAYVFALARELRKEYQLISSYGFLLQLDAPDFGLRAGAAVQGQDGCGVLARDGAQRRGHQSRNRRNSTRPDPASHLLGQLGRAAHPRFSPGWAPADSLSGESRRAQHRIRQSAASA